MPTRKEIEETNAWFTDENGDESCNMSIEKLRETALALMDENERLKVVKDEVGGILNGQYIANVEQYTRLEAENAHLKEVAVGYANLIDGWREKYGDLEKENACLKDDNEKLKNVFGDWKNAEPYYNLFQDNDRLREELTQRNSSYLRLSKSMSELSRNVEALRAVVEAAKKVVCFKHTTELSSAAKELEAALEKVKEGE